MSSEPASVRGYLEIPEWLNLAGYVVDRHVEEGRGARVAAWAAGRAYTFADLRALTNRFANALRALGVGHGDHVMLRLGTSLDTLIAILGTIKAGAIVLPTGPLLRDHEVEKILLNSEAVIAVSTPELLGPIEAVSARTPMLRHIILTGEDAAGGGFDGRRMLSWERVMAAASEDFAPARTHRDEPAFVIYTSGTTGDPKGVLQAHRWLIGAGDPYNREMVRMSPNDVCYQPQDWSFMYPLGSGCLYPLMEGAAIVVPHGRFTPEAAFETIERHRVTVFAAVPTIYRMMLAVPDAERRYRLDSLRVCVSAGEALPADTFNEFVRRFGVTIYDGIGQTETHIFIGNRIGMEVRPGSMGKPLSGYEAAILDDEGHEQKRGAPGHLVFGNSHPGLSLGYRKAAARWAAVNREGWYYTQDIAYVDADGYFWYVARADDLIKSRAYLVSPKEVESALLEHPAVLEAAVVGIPDPRIGALVKAFVALRTGHPASDALAEEIRNHVRAVIAPYKVPHQIEFMADLPKTANGKILRRVLRDRG
ncbi:MAG TPA: benzoate-CoA ligase family protein [Candidatus Binataceae bacterium]|nr:benzoate-CoA ligase family protein [Candidatus Binataceae bacterium]